MARINYSTLHDEIVQRIGPKGTPVGIKLFEDKAKFDELKIKRPKHHLYLCQVLKLASINELTMGIQSEDVDTCTLGNYVMGFTELPSDLVEIWITDQCYTREKFEALVKGMHTLPMGKNKAALFSALRTFEIKGINPDIVFLSVNSAQAHKILESYFDATCDKPWSDFFGHVACEIIAASINFKKPWLTIPCAGARVNAWVQDDEIWISMTPEQINKAIERLKNVGSRYPPQISGIIVRKDYKDKKPRLKQILDL